LFTPLVNLIYLDISFNILFQIIEETFIGMPKLANLDLSHNYLDGFGSIYSFRSFNFSRGKLNLSFNFVHKLAGNFLGQGLFNLSELNLIGNSLKLIENEAFKSLHSLISLNLELNSLNGLNENSLYNLNNLKSLFLNRNNFNCFISIRHALRHVHNLELIDLSNNFLEHLNETDFNFSSSLNTINLNSNRIRCIQPNSFLYLISLSAFKLALNNLNTLFDMSLINLESLTQLDLSFNKLNLSQEFRMKNIKHLILENVSIESNLLDRFLSSKIEYLDLSGNNNHGVFVNKTFPNLTRLELRYAQIDSLTFLTQLYLISLLHLDVSHNSLVELCYDESFQSILMNLVHLDLSFNRISFVDSRLFNSFQTNEAQKLKYLNLESNEIVSFGQILFTNYFELRVFKLTNNRLNEMPTFNSDQSGMFSPNNEEFLFNNNKIKMLSTISFSIWPMRLINLDQNQIFLIETNALLNMKRLEILSLSFNCLEKIEANNFVAQFNLRHLNLSYNRISFIENNSFINLAQLVSLDLSYNNELKSIQAYAFMGLESLNDLYLISNGKFVLNEKSFVGLRNLGNFYLNETMVQSYTCLLIKSIERDLKRNVGNRYRFYKSLNLLTNSLTKQIDMTFHLFQFGLHLNLRTDYENEIFYDEFRQFLIKRSNSFRSNYEKCYLQNVNTWSETNIEFEEMFDERSNVLKILSNFYFYLIILLLMVMFVPLFATVYNEFMQSQNKQVNEEEDAEFYIIPEKVDEF